MSNLANRVKTELVTRQLAVEAACQVITRAERLAKKDKSIIPPFQMEQMASEVRFCRDQVKSAEISLAAVNKYPPLTRVVL